METVVYGTKYNNLDHLNDGRRMGCYDGIFNKHNVHFIARAIHSPKQVYQLNKIYSKKIDIKGKKTCKLDEYPDHNE